MKKVAGCTEGRVAESLAEVVKEAGNQAAKDTRGRVGFVGRSDTTLMKGSAASMWQRWMKRRIGLKRKHVGVNGR